MPFIILAVIRAIGGSHHALIEGRGLICATHQSHRGERGRRYHATTEAEVARWALHIHEMKL